MNRTNSAPNGVAGAFHFILKAVSLSALVITLTSQNGRAGSATWTGTDFDDDWFYSKNWSPESVPNAPADIATFPASDQTSVDIHHDTGIEVDSIVFEQGAGSYALTVHEGDLIFYGGGITNNSGQLQNLVCGRVCYNCHGGYSNSINFENNASAGELTALTIEGPDETESFGGQLWFYNSSTAGSALITNAGASNASPGAETNFDDESSAENATIINDGSTEDGWAAATYFSGNASAGHATIINNGALSQQGQGGKVGFGTSADSADSTIICNGDTVGSDHPAQVSLTGVGRARVILRGNGELDVNYEANAGSVEGDGNILLGSASVLNIGTNNRNTTFTGIIQDASSASGGSLQKVGTGILTLTGANTYTGSTKVKAGELRLNNITGSATGTGTVQVKAGTLSGRGAIAGAVVIGDGGGANAFLVPAGDRIGTLTLQSGVTFNDDGNYVCQIDTRHAQADEVVANAVTISAGAVFVKSAIGHRQLAAGTMFTVINNTAATPIAGTFSNLADGSIIVIGGNTFQANYEGGDGNDLALTRVP